VLLVSLVGRKWRGRSAGVDEVPCCLRNPKVDEGWSSPGPEQALPQPWAARAAGSEYL